MTWSRHEHWEESRQRLLFADRKARDDFSPTELLFFRYSEALLGGKVPHSAIRCPDDKGTSCNRQKVSIDRDVLFPCFYHCGVSAIEVQQLPDSLPSGTGVTIAFRIVHDPARVLDRETEREEENFAHTLIFTMDAASGSVRIKKRFSKALKTLVRTVLSEGMRIISPPRGS